MSDEDIVYVLDNALRLVEYEYDGEDRLLIIGPDRHGTLRELDADTTGLDGISPATHPGRDASGFRAVRAAAKNVETAEQELREAVHTARGAGDSWAIIGTALGISRQAAQQRFSA